MSPYGTKRPVAWVACPYSDGPVQAQHAHPISFTMHASVIQGWSLMDVVKAQGAQAWSSTTTVAAQHVAKYMLHISDPVAADFNQSWNLSAGQVVQFSGPVVRAFHRGEIV